MLDADAPRGQSSVIGNLLLIGVVVVAGGVLGFAVLDIATDLDSAPEQASVTISDVEASNENIPVEQIPDGQCQDYHLVITMEHAGGAEFTSDDLEYVVDLNGVEDEELSGRFNSTDATPDVIIGAGDEIIIAIDGDTNFDNCGDQVAESPSTIVFGGATAWNPDDVGQADELFDTHNTFMEAGSPDDLGAVRVQIVDTDTDTVLIDEATGDIDDDSPSST